jgi:hypothetical protein
MVVVARKATRDQLLEAGSTIDSELPLLSGVQHVATLREEPPRTQVVPATIPPSRH